MTNLLLENIEMKLLDELNMNAAGKGITPEEEAKQWLWQTMERRKCLQQFAAAADDLARRAGPQSIDSTDLIREDRDS